MTKHWKIYNDFWKPESIIAQTYQCTACGNWLGTDIHHQSSRGMGGSKCKDYIENLICLCRKCHDKCHKDKQYNKKARIINLRLIADKLESELNES
tara:strand:+ start:2270 stop:2557 length:288 start_codon:yes stop_codon:yes gene_type:complete